MIRQLNVNNIVLIDSCSLEFSSGFNVITGETGAGKTALIQALNLVLGARADISCIRKGCDRAYVEAYFTISALGPLQEQLENSGLLGDAGELVVRREIFKEGKNRAFVNCRAVPLPLLQEISNLLIDRVDQHSHQHLRTHQSQLVTLDLFGDLEKEREAFQAAYSEEANCLEALNSLIARSGQKERSEEIFKAHLKEIEEAALQEGEEEALFEQHQKLAHAQELGEKIGQILGNTMTLKLSESIKICDKLLPYDKKLEEPRALLYEAHISLSEAHRFLDSYQEQIHFNPTAIERMESRMNQIAKLKRKYGNSLSEIKAYAQKIQQELDQLEGLLQEIEQANIRLKEAQTKTDTSAKLLSIKRKETAEELESRLTQQLQDLNMHGAELKIEVAQCQRSSYGEDHVQFFLKANQGELRGLVREHSSGGELSRLLFAIKIVLAEKNNTPTLIFDEIDANVGGHTASIIGEKLQKLGTVRQILCITHFPQVATRADTHFKVEKIASDGRTLTQIASLGAQEKAQELLRMMGGKQLIVDFI